jgi:adenosine deaminase
METSMELSAFLIKLPKVELHCHLEGSVQAATFVELARKHGVQLPDFSEPKDLYDYDNILDFLRIYDLVAYSVRDRDDFRRITYETLEEGVRSGLRYREMFWSPMAHMDLGVPYKTAIDGIIDGIHEAEADKGVQCRLIADINRMESAEKGLAMVETVLDNRRDELIGIGLDYAEAGNPPEKFADAFKLAKAAGLHLTAHACEDAPPVNITTALDVLKAERIDHGYHILEDEQVVQRCLDDEVVFTCTPTSTAWVYGWSDLASHPIRDMARRGLKITLNSDDPPMFKTDLGREYVVAAQYMDFQPADFKRFVLNGIDGSWLDEHTKRQWCSAWSEEIDGLLEELA